MPAMTVATYPGHGATRSLTPFSSQLLADAMDPVQYEEGITIKRAEYAALKTMQDEWLFWLEDIANAAVDPSPSLSKIILYHYIRAELAWVTAAMTHTDLAIAALEQLQSVPPGEEARVVTP